MICKKEITGNLVRLRTVEMTDCNETYLQWMTDAETNQYMETRWTATQTVQTIKNFVESMRQSPDSILFAITEKTSGIHIGNIKIGPVNQYNHYADISYFIGEKSCRNRGMATEAVRLICDFGFQELGLHRIQAGAIIKNEASVHVLQRAGFQIEGRLKEKYLVNGEYVDCYIMGLCLDHEEMDL